MPAANDCIDTLCSTLIHELWEVHYAKTNFATDGKWRRVEVKVTPPPGFPRLVARNRKGYYALGHALGDRGSAAALSPP